MSEKKPVESYMPRITVEQLLPNLKTALAVTRQRVYKLSELKQIVSDSEIAPKSHEMDQLIQYLINDGQLQKIQMQLGVNGTRLETRYKFENASTYSVAHSLYKDSYFSHQTAMHINGITSQESELIYLNHEQPKHKSNVNPLTQESIDRAFENTVRTSHNITSYQGRKICILNGMFTNQYGVITGINSQNETLRFTGIARTLIDIAVRPIYSGGLNSVLAAYCLAKGKVTSDEIIATLQVLQFIYPYHQAIGFYMEKSEAYSADEIKKISEMKMEYDFYLAHKMTEAAYSRRWRLYYPKEWEY
jgi:predicted transcriptional regulator of viral defense system